MDVVQQQRNMARRRTASSAESPPNDKDTTTTTAVTNPVENSQEGDNSNQKPVITTAATSSNGNGTNNSAAAYTAVTRPGPFARFRGRLTSRRRSNSAPAAPGRRGNRTRRRLLIQDHFNVETTAVTLRNKGAGGKKVVERPVVLPGVPHHDPDWHRDTHDFFNLIVLIPVVALNIMNWNWDHYLWWKTHQQGKRMQNSSTAFGMEDAWTGEWFNSFFYVSLAYFTIDLAWILLVPSCVKSPSTIIQHHTATMVYLLLPFYYEDLRWCMGACMIVEVNTWFLIARRVFNKQGFPPWTIELGSFASIRIKLISVFFYVTWIGIRCILYPYLMPQFYQKWVQHTEEEGTPWNMVMLCVPLHAVFCLLNMKWTYDLFSSKMRFWARAKNNRKAKEAVDKGL